MCHRLCYVMSQHSFNYLFIYRRVQNYIALRFSEAWPKIVNVLNGIVHCYMKQRFKILLWSIPNWETAKMSWWYFCIPNWWHHECSSYPSTYILYHRHIWTEGRRGCDRMVVGFTTTCAISAYHHYSCEFEPRSWRGVLDTTLCDKVCQWLVTGQWISPGTPVSSTNKTYHHDNCWKWH